ncbi:MAG: FecR domain-containing protein [Deltaproteobacteria bacterium]|nr:FecR domain-containing protein [Deltaproteobacteria bacterium]
MKASRCRIKLLNNDVITLGAHTRITVKEVVGGERNTPEKKTNLSMARGQAMFYAIRTLSQKGAVMTVESPTSVAGVRGTKFGMEVTIEGENSTAALPLLLADASVDWGRHLILAQASPPPPSITTTVHGFDGTVTVTSTVDGRTQSVGAGQTVSATPQGVSAPTPTPPQVSQSFQAATNVPPPGGGAGGSQSSGGSSGTASGNAPDAKTTSDATGTSTTNMPDTSSITQQQNVNKEEEKAAKKEAAKDPVTDPKTNAPGAGGSSGRSKGYGYFASLLSNTTDGTLAGAFASQYRYDGDSSVWARGPNDADYVRVLGNSGIKGSATLKWVVFDSGNKNSGELNSSISSTTLGENDYMEWGYATIGSSFTVDNKNYAFDNRAYWIFGGNIPSMVNLSGQVTYTGAAYGTYWSAAGGSNMTGTFKTDVNLTSAAMSNFSLDVSGNGANAYIHNASGTIGSDATFYLTGGTWNLNGVTPDKTTANGSLYGSDGAGMGGVWGMYSTAYNTSATGIFAGTNKQMGHYAGMLEYLSGGQYRGYSGTYMTTSAQDFNSSTAKAENSTYYTTIDGTGSPKNMTALTVSGDSITVGNKAVSFSQIGANEYMSWGTWTQAEAMSGSGCDYYFKNQGAYVWGSPTTDSEMATLKSNAITGTYSGNAWGTYFVANSAGTDLKGTFSSTVNFASQTPITNFTINVADASNTKTVAISGATGTFSGTTGQTSTFAISSGTWKINNTTATNTGASGTVYGNGTDKGKYIGGVWQAGYSTDKAVGGFQGSK